MGNYSNRFGGSHGRGGFSTRGRGFIQQVSSSGAPPNATNSAYSRPVCQICGSVGHVALKCWNRFDNSYQSIDIPKAMYALQISGTHPNEWYSDSGASSHITNTFGNLQNPTVYVGAENVMVADGSFLPITHVGSTTLPFTLGNLPLNDVLVCPSIQKPWLSVSKLCDDYPCGVYFDADHVCVLDKKTLKVLTQGNKHNSLYRLEDPSAVAYYSTRQQVVSDEV